MKIITIMHTHTQKKKKKTRFYFQMIFIYWYLIIKKNAKLKILVLLHRVLENYFSKRYLFCVIKNSLWASLNETSS